MQSDITWLSHVVQKGPWRHINMERVPYIVYDGTRSKVDYHTLWLVDEKKKKIAYTNYSMFWLSHSETFFSINLYY